MKVILLQNILKLGKIGEICNVKRGYARNYLLPAGKVLEANEKNEASFKERKQELEAQEIKRTQDAQLKAEKLKEITLTIGVKSSDEGKLYGSVRPVDLVALIANEFDLQIAVSEIIMPLERIRQLGVYEMSFLLNGEVEVPHTINVVNA